MSGSIYIFSNLRSFRFLWRIINFINILFCRWNIPKFEINWWRVAWLWATSNFLIHFIWFLMIATIFAGRFSQRLVQIIKFHFNLIDLFWLWQTAFNYLLNPWIAARSRSKNKWRVLHCTWSSTQKLSVLLNKWKRMCK